MKRRQVSFLVVGVLALVATGCAHKSSQPASEASTPVQKHQKHLSEVIELPRQRLIFKPTRDDMTVGRMVFNVFSSNPEEVRVNGARLDPAWMSIDLSQVSTNQFELAPLKIEFSRNEHRGQLCMSVKAYFNEVTTQYDSMYYQNVDDRYGLVSYCTSLPDHSLQGRARFRQNPVATVSEFKEALSRPFVIKLNQRPLRKEWSR